ncbi:MAG TPA: glutathione S-transferase family protein [Burkholderiaceae bacterium]|jgi:glutathione S-transferase
MKLYYNPLSTFSQKALLAFYEKGVEFEREIVKLSDPESRATYEKIYPIGKVPLLIIDGGHMIPESTIIIEYLEGHYAQGTRLIPEGVNAARKVRFHDRMADLYVDEQAVKVLFNQMKIREYLPADIERARQLLNISYEFINRSLEDCTWLCGSEFSMADCALIPSLFYVEKLVPFADFHNLAAYWQRAQQRPSYQKVRAEFMPIWESMMGARKTS